MLDGLVLGWRSALLLGGAVHLAILAFLLLHKHEEQRASRALALLLVVALAAITPQIIGFAGFYDAFPWLSFAPFDMETAIGPLIYAYVCLLTTGRLGWLATLLFLPAAVEVTYYTLNFLRPTVADKWAFNDAVHVPYVLPVFDGLTVVLLLAGLSLAFGRYRRYLAWLGQATSRKADFDARWLGAFLVAMAVVSLLWISYEAVELVVGQRLSYVDGYWFYPTISLLAFAVGLGGLLGVRQPFPKPTPAPAADTPASTDEISEARKATHTLAEDGPPARDWAQQAATLEARVVAAGWHLDSGLTCRGLAHRLGTNETYLSRTINRGLQMNFNRFINSLRVEAAKSALSSAPERDILSIAYDSGFRSKATFNRVFKELSGETPAGWRRRQLES